MTTAMRNAIKARVSTWTAEQCQAALRELAGRATRDADYRWEVRVVSDRLRAVLG